MGRGGFGERATLERVTLRWEAACAAEYAIEVSDDGRLWRRVAHRTDGRGGTEVLGGLSATGRWLRVLCLRPGPHRLYSIWEVGLGGPVEERLAARRAARESELRTAALERCAKAGIREVVAAVREVGDDGHWYANIFVLRRG